MTKEKAHFWRNPSEVFDFGNGKYLHSKERIDGMYKGYYIEIYPVIINGKKEGYEYTLLYPENEEKSNFDRWDSMNETSNGGDHARTIKQVKEWAIQTIEDILEEI